MSKNLNILTIYEYHNSSACISQNGKIMAAFNEDRFVKKKNEVSFPLNSIKACLKKAKLKPKDINFFGIVNDKNSLKNKNSILNFLFKRQSRYSVSDWKKENELYWKPTLLENKKKLSFFKSMGGKKKIAKDHHLETKYYDDNKNFNKLKKDFFEKKIKFIKKLGFNENTIVFIPHYITHHYHAFYSSPNRYYKNSLIIHCEGDGGKYNHAISKPSEKSGIKFLNGTNKFNLGRLYQWTTLNLNMLPYHDEYKVMGLAPYSKIDKKNPLYLKFSKYFSLNKKKFLIELKKKPKDLYFEFRKFIINQRFDKVAAILQDFLETKLIELFSYIYKKKKIKNFYYGGGVAMNVKANLAINKKLPKINSFFVPLSPADETNVFGANYYLMEKFFIRNGTSLRNIKSLNSVYLGNSYNFDEKKYKKSKNYKIEKVNHKKIAKLLASGKIIGRFTGRAEFGQRALGNRSILASISYPNIVDKINQKIKSRDFWMPFALTILDIEKKYFYKNSFINPFYMTSCFDLKKKYKKNFINVIHPADQTARPQILKKFNNPSYYDLIMKVKKTSGIGAVLNTSFNVHGKTIVENPSDAIKVLRETNLDGLIIDNFFVEKK